MFKIKLENPPAGYSASIGKSGEMVSVITREFTSSEDGDFFIARLEGIPTQIISQLPQESGIKCSNIDHLLAIIDNEGDCEVYANELEIISMVRAKRAVKKNEPMYEDDLADIVSLEFEGVIIPENSSIVVILSKGWRKGLFFDFSPVHNEGENRDYELSTMLGHYYNYLFFQDLYKISKKEWSKFFQQQWFPFVGLKAKNVRKLVDYIRADWNADEILEEISLDVTESLKSKMNDWEKTDFFGVHLDFFKRACDRFLEGDFISCTSILYPRIEGLLRDLNKEVKAKSYSQNNLSEAPMKFSKLEEGRYSRILPAKFIEYLKEVYFANFDPNTPAEISRNSVGHGVAKPESYSEKSSVIGFLILEQLYYHQPVNLKAVKSATNDA